jgi:hypothetical protein
VAGVPPANPLTAAGTAASTAVALRSDLLSSIGEFNIFVLTGAEAFPKLGCSQTICIGPGCFFPVAPDLVQIGSWIK